MLPGHYWMRIGARAFRITSKSHHLMPATALNSRSFLLQSIALSQRHITTALTKGSTAQKAKQSISDGKADSATLTNAKPLSDDAMIEVEWGNKSMAKYPYIWLRDNCYCPHCRHVSSGNRRVLLQDLDISVTPASMTINETGDELEILWSDGHKAQYPSVWLQQRSFREEQREKRQQMIRFNRTYWNSDLRNQLPEANFNNILQDDSALLDFLLKLENLGLVIVHDAPCRVGEIVTLSNHIGFLKRTHYGHTFAVKQKVDANNLAYTSDALNLHVDLPYLVYKPGCQLLHCISQTPGKGGENHIVDSFHVANRLREIYPEKFKILTTTLVNFHDHGVEDDGFEFHALSQDPMIVLDREGIVSTVNFNQMARDSYFNVPAEKVAPWYDAMLTFLKLLYHPENLITYKMKEGDILVFDNNRVMHGRTGYKMTEGARELEGCYWDWDMVKSRRRITQAKLGIEQ